LGNPLLLFLLDLKKMNDDQTPTPPPPTTAAVSTDVDDAMARAKECTGCVAQLVPLLKPVHKLQSFK